MAYDNGKPNSPPFATPNGSPETPKATGPSKPVDLVTDPSGGAGKTRPADIMGTRAPNKASGPRFNTDTVPAGGAILLADPKLAPTEASGYTTGPARPGKMPFKLTNEGGGEAEAGSVPEE